MKSNNNLLEPNWLMDVDTCLDCLLGGFNSKWIIMIYILHGNLCTMIPCWHMLDIVFLGKCNIGLKN